MSLTLMLAAPKLVLTEIRTPKLVLTEIRKVSVRLLVKWYSFINSIMRGTPIATGREDCTS